MLNSPFFRRLFVPYVVLIVLATAAVGFFAARTVRSTYIDRQTDSLRENIRLIAHSVAPRLDAPAALDALVKQIFAATGNRVTIMRADGVVVADSEADPATM